VDPSRVAVVGAGWAGLSAAARLCQAGHSVTLFEAARTLGGRARGVEWKQDSGRVLALDNGQHILLGAYRETLALLALCGLEESDVLLRQTVRLEAADGFALVAWRLPAPWHLLMALLCARHLSVGARWDMMRLILGARWNGWRIPRDLPVGQWLKEQGQCREITEKVWAPLCVAALNTPVDVASAQVFLNVLRDSLGAYRRASDLLLPKASLDALLPGPCAAFITQHGGAVRLATRVTQLLVSRTEITLETAQVAPERFAAAVLAVPAHQVPALIGEPEAKGLGPLVAQCAQLRWQPITTVYLDFGPALRLKAPMLALSESIEFGHFGQWVFDKGQLGGPQGLLAVVISAQGPHQDLGQDALGRAVAEQLRIQLGLSQTASAMRVISEKRATFACLPGLSRPKQRTAAARLVLAGDHTESPYPATLETAIASGRTAADLVTKALAAL
jgi:squalene-associated FAD-dependent desaturase